MTRTVLLAAGGTGGHVFPGLATAAALKAAHPDIAVEFVGTSDRLEARLVPEAGWTLHTVPAVAMSRRNLLRLPWVLGQALRRTTALIRTRDVIAAVCFGGYTSVPLALAARVTGTPLVVHEQNAIPGRANRMAARSASAVAVTFEQARSAFAGVRTVLTGNPVRPDLLHGDQPSAEVRTALRQQAVQAFDLDPDRRTLLVFGGSQGALRINTAVTGSAVAWQDPGRLQILHAAGRQTYAATKAAWDAADLTDGPSTLRVRCVEFIDRMDLAYAAADVVVCRAGASSIAELTALALPAVLVPYPYATADHQTANAQAVAQAGGAVVVADAELDADSLVAAAEPLLLDPSRHAAMVTGAASFGRPQAAQDLAQLVASVAGLTPGDRPGDSPGDEEGR